MSWSISQRRVKPLCVVKPPLLCFLQGIRNRKLQRDPCFHYLNGYSGLTRTAATAVTATATKGGDLAQSVGLTDPAQVMNWLDNPETAALFASATGMSPEEARATLAQLRGRIEAIRDNPERVATEVRTFLAQYKERAEQQALRAAAAVQKGASVGAWVTFGVLTLTLVASILGALAGVPSLHTWRARWAQIGAA